jgi:hypothetical protein
MAGFRDLSDRLAELQGLPSRITREASESITELLAEEFAQSKNAYGNAWKPLKTSTVRRKGGDTRILRDTDDLASATVARPSSGSGIEIVSGDVGGYHQTGTKRMVARKILPDGSALPKSWTQAVQDAAENAFKKVMTK